jgi:3-deoxy-7-phosphoheptulonate synthase
MMIVMEPQATAEQVEHITARLEAMGFKTVVTPGENNQVIAALGKGVFSEEDNLDTLAAMDGVKEILQISEPYKLANRDFHPQNTQITFHDGETVGAPAQPIVIAGPCSLDRDYPGIVSAAKTVKAAGCGFFRGGAFKPRTSPYDFQGLGREGLNLLKDIKGLTGLKIVTEVMDTSDLEAIVAVADMVQVGARNMQNFSLLKAVGAQAKPVLLKRGLSATIREFLLAAEYIMAEGNQQVILCERGIRGFDSTFTRNVLDLAAIPVLKKLSHLPVIVDPSHATGHRYLVAPMAKAALAAGADGVMVEVHPNPDHALSDGAQSLHLEEFEQLIKDLSNPFTPLLSKVSS